MLSVDFSAKTVFSVPEFFKKIPGFLFQNRINIRQRKNFFCKFLLFHGIFLDNPENPVYITAEDKGKETSNE